MKSGEVILANIGRLYGKADLLKLGHDSKICMRESLEWGGGVGWIPPNIYLAA